MSTNSHKLSAVAAQFFSDTHSFHPHNGGAYKHVQKLYASEAERLYFVGDIVDFEYIAHALKKKNMELDQFPHSFERVLDTLEPENRELHLRLFDAMYYQVDRGAQVTYLGGNHDEGLDLIAGEMIDGVMIQKEALYDAGPHGRYHVEHGQHFDIWFGKEYSDWGSYNACRILDGALAVDDALKKSLPAFKDLYPLTNTIKGFAKSVGVVKPFKKNALAKAFNKGVDGVICGHIHKSANKIEDYKGQKLRYINTGDGLTHGTSLAHMKDGEWVKIKRKALPQSSEAVLGEVNPLAKYRSQTINFLQRGWEAQLAYLHAKEQMKKKASPQVDISGVSKPVIV